jgi:hypothetical protein
MAWLGLAWFGLACFAQKVGRAQQLCLGPRRQAEAKGVRVCIERLHTPPHNTRWRPVGNWVGGWVSKWSWQYKGRFTLGGHANRCVRGLKSSLVIGQKAQMVPTPSHLEIRSICCVRGLKSSLVIGQKVQIGPNPFTPRGRANSLCKGLEILTCD